MNEVPNNNIAQSSLNNKPLKRYYKTCPKCKGTIYLEKDTYGIYEDCAMCGYTHDLNTEELNHLKGYI